MMATATERQSNMKEIYMGDIQQNSRPCAMLHCAYQIEPVSQFQVLPIDTVLEAITDRLGVSSAQIYCSKDDHIISSPQRGSKDHEPKYK